MVSPRYRFTTWPWFFNHDLLQRVDRQDGWNGDKKQVLPYLSVRTETHGSQQNVNYPMYYTAQDCLGVWSVQSFLSGNGFPSWSQPYYNRAYEKFRSRVLGESSQLGVFVAEWKESFGMISTRAIGLVNAVNSLKRGRLDDFIGYLGLGRPLRKHRSKKAFAASVAKDASGTWLEYWFGWSASVADIHGALKVLSSPLPYGSGYGSATGWLYKHEEIPGYSRLNRRLSIHYRVGGEVLLTNPNLFLLNQLGLVNPLQVGELIPFSFLLDWGTGVLTYLRSFSDWVGVELRNPYTTSLLKIHEDSLQYLNPAVYKQVPSVVTGVCMRRIQSIPQPLPNLQFVANVGNSLTRAASAASLLTQTLHSLKKK